MGVEVVSDRPGLSRDKVVDTALAIVDRDGLDGLTMRRLAGELGVEAMSLYHWFPNKAAILDALVEAAIRETASAVDAERPTAGWRDSLRALAVAYRRVLLAHPNTLPVHERPTREVRGVDALHRADARGAAHGRASRRASAVQAMQAVLAYILGAVSAEIGRADAARTDGGVPRALPHRRSSRGSTRWRPSSAARRRPATEQFAFGLDALLDGIGLRLAGVGSP